jgi:hypothetical protein
VFYYWLYLKDQQDRVQHTFLLEEVSAEAALARAANLDCGDLSVEVWDEDRLLGRVRREQKVAEPA